MQFGEVLDRLIEVVRAKAQAEIRLEWMRAEIARLEKEEAAVMAQARALAKEIGARMAQRSAVPKRQAAAPTRPTAPTRPRALYGSVTHDVRELLAATGPLLRSEIVQRLAGKHSVNGIYNVLSKRNGVRRQSDGTFVAAQ